ncbi:MAG: hypothetical protein MUO72_13520 [Bacteroidales bacterium]|nr:hypothetical protein [Bacteroidales bacterium]
MVEKVKIPSWKSLSQPKDRRLGWVNLRVEEVEKPPSLKLRRSKVERVEEGNAA